MAMATRYKHSIGLNRRNDSKCRHNSPAAVLGVDVTTVFVEEFFSQMFRRTVKKMLLIALAVFLTAQVSSIYAFSYQEYATGIEVNMTDTFSYQSLWGADVGPNSLEMLNLIYDPQNNLCPNGDFEIEGPANWTQATSGDVTITRQQVDDSNVMVINRPTTGYGYLSSDFIPVTYSSKYIFLWSAKISGEGYVPMVRISAYDSAKQFLSYVYQHSFPAYTSWKKYYDTYTPAFHVKYIKIDLFLYNQGGTVYYDNIQVITHSNLLSGANLGANMYAVFVVEAGGFIGGGHGGESNINLSCVTNSDFVNVTRTAECPYFNTVYQTIYDSHNKKIYETMNTSIVQNFSSCCFYTSMQADNKLFNRLAITLLDDSVTELVYVNNGAQHFYDAKKIIQTHINNKFSYTHMLVLDPQYITHTMIKDEGGVKKLYGADSNTDKNYTVGQTVFLRTFHMWEVNGFDWNSVSTDFPDIVAYPSGSYYLHPKIDRSVFSLNIPAGAVNVKIDTWLASGDYYKKWTETSDTSGSDTQHIIGDLEAGTYYIVKVDGIRLNTYLSNPLGRITFTCDGSILTRTFEVEQDPVPPTRADIGGDFAVNFVDFAALAQYWLATDCSDTNFWCEGADINKDGAVDIADMDVLGFYWLWTAPETQADLNTSGSIDFYDFAILSGQWGENCSSPGWCYGSDFDKSTQVDVLDLARFSEFWLASL